MNSKMFLPALLITIGVTGMLFSVIGIWKPDITINNAVLIAIALISTFINLVIGVYLVLSQYVNTAKKDDE